MKVVIIAAGCGSRLKDKHHGLPKSLVEINGKRIIDVIISKVIQCGITDVVIVTGYMADTLEAELQNYAKTDLNIQFVHNNDWDRANGISVLKAKSALSVDDEFILLMSDHIFETEILQRVVQTKIKADEALLGIDFKISDIPDLDDGMKIQCSEMCGSIYRISNFGKTLAEYSAIDTGIFKFNYNFFDVLEKAVVSGNDSLSDSCNLLCKENKMLGLDIEDKIWLDIDTPEMMDETTRINKILKN